MKTMWKRIISVLLSAALALSLTAPAFAAYRNVPTNHWAADDIQYVTERGLFNGTSPDTFGPSTEMSRAMLATVLYRYAGSPAVSEAVPYVDVTTGAWYMPGVAWAYRNRIFADVNLSRTLLYPDEDVRWAEFCIMPYNFAKTLGKASSDLDAIARAPFTDMEWNRFSMAGFGPSYSEAEEGMLGWAWPMGIMNGAVEYRTESEYHAVVVVGKTDSYLKVTESSINNMVRWGGQYFKWWLEEQPHYSLYTRYPE